MNLIWHIRRAAWILRTPALMKSRARWLLNGFVDTYLTVTPALKCPICDFSAATTTFKACESRCALGGGRLTRHECPSCGVIFGSERMLSMSKSELNREYLEYYSWYPGREATEEELEVFGHLKPKESGLYLNFGCGRNTRTIPIIREKGYQLYGFDPYAYETDFDDRYIIANSDKLRTMKFDGIMSNDVLEHLRYPAQTLSFLSSILKDDGFMVHRTECYSYACPQSRFHLFFFTGDSLRIICQKSGLRFEDTPDPAIKIFRKDKA